MLMTLISPSWIRYLALQFRNPYILLIGKGSISRSLFRYATLDNIDLNSDRPTHGLDQQSLISDPNVQIEAEATETLSFPFGVQKSVMHLDQSSSEFSPRGLQEFRISPSDVGRIHSILAFKLLFLDTLTINKVLSQTVAHLTMLNDNEATRIFQSLPKNSDSNGKLTDKR